MIHDSMVSAAWQLLPNSTLSRQGSNLRIVFPPNTTILKASQIYAFHITFPSKGLLYYDRGQATPVASNETLQLFNGRAVYFTPFAKNGEDFIKFIGLIGYSLCK